MGAKLRTKAILIGESDSLKFHFQESNKKKEITQCQVEAVCRMWNSPAICSVQRFIRSSNFVSTGILKGN
jgi:hypothetical protein